MAYYKEKVANQRIGGSGRKKFAKQQMNRALRRKAKRDPENAPQRKRFYGTCA